MRWWPMYRALVAQQFQLQRLDVAALTVLAGMVTPAAVWLASESSVGGTVTDVLLSANTTLAVLAVPMAMIVGLLCAVRPYVADSVAQHTYARSLPIQRGHYASLRIASGLTLALLPIAGFAIGTWLTTLAMPIPDELYAYPLAITVRFLLATVLAFAMSFALQYGAGRQAARLAVVCIVLLGIVELTNTLLLGGHLTDGVWRAITSESSPLGVYTSTWMLFDV